MKPSNTIIVSNKYIEEKERQIADLSKKVEHLQEQLERAKKSLREAGEMALSNETDISKIHDIVHPVIVYLNGGVK